MTDKYEVNEGLKALLKFSSNHGIHEQELANYTPEKQQEIYDFITGEIEEMFSFCMVMNQIKNDPDTNLGSLRS